MKVGYPTFAFQDGVKVMTRLAEMIMSDYWSRLYLSQTQMMLFLKNF